MVSIREPNVDDARILLDLESIRYAPPVERAFSWAAREMQRKDAPTLKRGNAEQAEADEAVNRFSTFFETAGVLVRDGLLHEDVFFDRYMVRPFWKLAHDEVDRQRKDSGTAAVAENFEWLAQREPEVQARSGAFHREAEARRR